MTRLRIVDDANLCYPFCNRQLEVEQLSHGARRSGVACELSRRLEGRVQETNERACARLVPATAVRVPLQAPLTRLARSIRARACARMASVDALRGSAAAGTARPRSKAAVLRSAAAPRRVAPPLKCAFRPDAFSQPPPEAAAAHSCPYAELGAARPLRFLASTLSGARRTRLRLETQGELA